MYFYTIYTIITSPTLNYMCCPWVYYTITTRWTYYSYTLNIISLVSSTMFQTYDIASCDVSCDFGHIPLHHLRNRKEKKIDKRK